jgi:hypothetical protein
MLNVDISGDSSSLGVTILFHKLNIFKKLFGKNIPS